MLKFLLLISTLSISLFSITSNEDISSYLNFNFEQRTPSGEPEKWSPVVEYDEAAGRYKTPKEQGFSMTLDSSVVHSGKYSLKLEVFPGCAGGGAGIPYKVASEILAKYLRGKKITYSGWIKTQNITDWVGLFCGDGKGAFNNMHDSTINGTRGWHKYSITLQIHPSSTKVVFGVLTASTNGGTAWFDDLSIDTNGVSFIR